MCHPRKTEEIFVFFNICLKTCTDLPGGAPDSVARRVCHNTSHIVTSPVWSGGGQSQSPAAETRDAEIENTGPRQRMSRLKVTKEAAVFYF